MQLLTNMPILAYLHQQQYTGWSKIVSSKMKAYYLGCLHLIYIWLKWQLFQYIFIADNFSILY